MAYDIIGDIHGQGDKLHALLAHLGYRVTEGPIGTRVARLSSSATSSTAVLGSTKL